MSQPERHDGQEAKVIPIRGGELEPIKPAALEPLEPTRVERSAVAPTSVWDAKILPDRTTIKQWAEDCYWAFRLRARKAVIHFVRSPLYAARCLPTVPQGLWKLLASWWEWVQDHATSDRIAEVWGDKTVQAVARDKRVEDDLEKQRQRRYWRSGISAAWVLFGPMAALWLWSNERLLAVVGALGGIIWVGWHGGQRGHIVQHIDLAPVSGIPDPERIVRAFIKGEVLKVSDEPARVFGVPMRDGAAWSAHVGLPEGKTFAQAVAKRENLASALGYPADCMELEPLSVQGRPESELLIHMALEHPGRRARPRWPMLDADRHDIFQPFPIGWDLRGRLVMLSLMWVHTLLGAAPQRGKSTLLRMMAVATLLDPRADLIVVDFGGGTQFRPFEPYARKVINGSTAEEVAEFRALLDWLQKEYQRRQAKMRTLPLDEAPDGKITPALAGRRDFRIIVVLVDEFQVATRSKTLGADIITEWAELKKVCPKMGIIFAAATQAADESLPTELRNVSLQRIALSVATWQGSKALTGDEAYSRGLDASKLGGIKGYGVVWGIDDEGIEGFKGRASFANCTVADAHVLLQRIAAKREVYVEAEPAGPDRQIEATDAEVPMILRDVLAVWPRPSMECHRKVLAKLLDMDPGELTRQMRAAGMEPPPTVRMRIGGESVPDRGWRLVDVEAAVKRAQQ